MIILFAHAANHAASYSNNASRKPQARHLGLSESKISLITVIDIFTVSD